MTTASNRRMMMSPIYNFDISGYPEESKWGWHRAREVFETINNILEAKGSKRISPLGIEELIPNVTPQNVVGRVRSCGIVPTWLCLTENNGVRLTEVNSGEGWFVCAVRQDDYIPAKLGMEMIKVIKNPTASQIKKKVQRMLSQ